MKKTKTYLLALAAATLTAMGALTACTDLPATDADAAGTDTDVPQGCIRISPDALPAPSFGTAAATRAAATDPTGRRTLIADGTAATRAATRAIGTANTGKSAWATGDRLTYVLLIETGDAATPLFRITLNARCTVANGTATWAFATATDPVPTGATDPAAIATNGLRVERHAGGTDATDGWTDMTLTYAGTVTPEGVLRLPPAVTDALDGGETVAVRMAVQYRSQAFTEITTANGLTTGNLTTDAQAAYATGERWTLLPDDAPTELHSGIGLTLKPTGTWLPTIANALRRLNAATTGTDDDIAQAKVCYSRLRVATTAKNKVKMTVNTAATAADGGSAIAFLPAGFDPWSGSIGTSGDDNTTLTFVATADGDGNAFFYGYPAKTTADGGNGIKVNTTGTDDFSADVLERLRFTNGTTKGSEDIKVSVLGEAEYTPENRNPITVTAYLPVFVPSSAGGENYAWHLTGGEGTALDGTAPTEETVTDADVLLTINESTSISADKLKAAYNEGKTVWRLEGSSVDFSTVKKTLNEIYNSDNNIASFSLILPEVTEIGISALEDVRNLKNVVLGEKLTKISTQAFRDCNYLTDIDLSGCIQLETINESAFSGCTRLATINLSGCTKLTLIGNYAFNYCSALTDIDLSGCIGLNSIGSYAFQYCSTLPDIDLSGCSSLVTIGNYAFSYCDALTAVTFGSAIKSWGRRVFYHTNTAQLTLTLHPDQKQMTNNDNENADHAVADPETPFFPGGAGEGQWFCGHPFKEIKELGTSASTPSAR